MKTNDPNATASSARLHTDGMAGGSDESRTAPTTGELRAAERERDEAEASRDRFSFLAEVSRCLGGSLDYEATLTTVAGMSLPYLDAWCIVDVLTEDGVIRRLAVLHPDGAKQATARALHVNYPPRADDFLGAPRVIRTGRPEMVFSVPDAALTAAARDPQHLTLLRTLGVQAYVIVPMVARGQVLGAMTFVTAESGRRFGDIDVVMAEDLARRAAMAVDNARLHREALDARESAEVAYQEAELAAEAAEEAGEAAIQAQAVAEAALRSRGEFVAMVSHELRTPLNAIIGYAELMEVEATAVLTEPQRAYMKRLRDSSRHLRRLVDDLLDLSQLDAGKLAVKQAAVPVAPTAHEAVAIVEALAARERVTVVDACSGDSSLAFHGDEVRTRQILVNLLSNALKFTPAGGQVTLECGLEESAAESAAGTSRWIVFRVRDDGPGVRADKAELIFEPFVQGETGLTRSRGGTGLGLSISRRLAQLMGGDVRLEPSSDGAGNAGATFSLRLPAAGGRRSPAGSPAVSGTA